MKKMIQKTAFAATAMAVMAAVPSVSNAATSTSENMGRADTACVQCGAGGVSNHHMSKAQFRQAMQNPKHRQAARQYAKSHPRAARYAKNHPHAAARRAAYKAHRNMNHTM